MLTHLNSLSLLLLHFDIADEFHKWNFLGIWVNKYLLSTSCGAQLVWPRHQKHIHTQERAPYLQHTQTDTHTQTHTQSQGQRETQTQRDRPLWSRVYHLCIMHNSVLIAVPRDFQLCCYPSLLTTDCLHFRRMPFLIFTSEHGVNSHGDITVRSFYWGMFLFSVSSCFDYSFLCAVQAAKDCRSSCLPPTDVGERAVHRAFTVFFLKSM